METIILTRKYYYIPLYSLNLAGWDGTVSRRQTLTIKPFYYMLRAVIVASVTELQIALFYSKTSAIPLLCGDSVRLVHWYMLGGLFVQSFYSQDFEAL